MSITPTITYREYHPETGAMLNNVSSLSFGRVTKGSHSRVKVIDVAFNNVTNIGDIKIGLISDAGITVNPNPSEGTSFDDGSTSTGHFGIESSQDFSSAKASAPLSRHFAGLNSTGASDDEANVIVGYNTNTTTSHYIYLDVEVGSSNSGSGSGAYKIFFDFS